jgi:hypothetical protein
MEPSPTTSIRPTVPPRPVSISSRSIWRRISSRTKWQWYRSGPGRQPPREPSPSWRKSLGVSRYSKARRHLSLLVSRSLRCIGSATDVEIGKRGHRSRSSPGVRIQGFQWQGASQPSRTEGLFAPVLHEELILRLRDPPRELAEFLEPYRTNALATHPWKQWADEEIEHGEADRMPGGQSRWSQSKDLSWQPLRPELVVDDDHMQENRFRHTAQFRRWRIDKTPTDCTFAQLEVVPPQELALIFSHDR